MLRALILVALLLGIAGCVPAAVVGAGDVSAFEPEPGTTYCRADGSSGYAYKLYGQSCYARDKSISLDEYNRLKGTNETAAAPAQPMPTHFASFRDFLAATAGDEAAKPFTGEEQSEVRECVADAAADGIPYQDQATMLQAANSRSIDSNSAALFKKWLDVNLGHGKIVQPNINDPSTYAGGQLRYEDGTVVPPKNGSVAARVSANLPRHCPDLADRIRL